jgi:hypothetical protein
MRIAAVFNIWADCLCLLPYAIENIRPVVDEVIVVWSRKSNRGNVMDYELPKNCKLVQCEPVSNVPQINETAKRNAGLEAAKAGGFTHFIMLDSDEFYVQSDFVREKNSIEALDISGTVCGVQTYFKSPTLTIGIDHTIAPFIHKVTPSLQYKMNYAGYPMAYERGTARIDGTRRLNITKGVKMVDIVMHHMSWIRKDFKLKMENSSASFKAHRSQIVYDDLDNAKPGYFCKGYQRELVSCENIFNLPEYEL